MSPSWVSHPNNQPQLSDIELKGSRSYLSQRSKRFWIILGAVLLLIAVGLGVGLGVGLTRRDSGSDDDSSPEQTFPPPNNTTNTTTPGKFWKPEAGATWQIVLGYALNDTSYNVSVYDVDLYTNPKSTIDELHTQGRKVICYFSAGSYEDFRPDSTEFKKEDYGKPLDGWPGEWWLNTNSTNVRRIMSERLRLAQSKGCDGVDPDNIDGYDNDTGFKLTTSDAIDYLKFLATEAHGMNMSIGLKNAGAIVNQTLDIMQWEVNEQCVQYKECGQFRPFIDAGKPVFHIEYPDSAPEIISSTKNGVCDDVSSRGFSTLLKDMELTNFVEAC